MADISIEQKLNGWVFTRSHYTGEVYTDLAELLEAVASSVALDLEQFPIGSTIKIIKPKASNDKE